MNKLSVRTKRTIAREFLLLLLTILIALCSYLIMAGINWRYESKINTIEENTVSHKILADSLSSRYIAKTINGKDYISRVYLAVSETMPGVDKYGIPRLVKFTMTEAEFKHAMLSDKQYRQEIFDFLMWNLDGFTKNITEFETALKEQLTEKDIEDYNQSKVHYGKIYKSKADINVLKSSIIQEQEKNSITLKILIFGFIIIFAVRYLFYAIKWSLATLKSS